MKACLRRGHLAAVITWRKTGDFFKTIVEGGLGLKSGQLADSFQCVVLVVGVIKQIDSMLCAVAIDISKKIDLMVLI